MLFKTIVLLLPALSYCEVLIHIIATLPKNGANVEYVGANINIVGDRDITAFGLDKESLIQAVSAYSGELPTEVYVRNTTDDEDNIYARNSWSQVERIIIPTSGGIIDADVKEVELSSEEIINPSNESKLYTVEHEFELPNIFDGEKIKGADLSIGTQISYKVDFHIDGGMGDNSNTKTFTFKWPFGRRLNNRVDFQAQQRLNVDLEPYKEFSASMKVKKVTLDIELHYIAMLQGDIATYYPEGYRGQNYWAYDVNEVLKAAGKPTSLELSERIKVEYYVEPNIAIRK